jgi:hypothetical protein
MSGQVEGIEPLDAEHSGRIRGTFRRQQAEPALKAKNQLLRLVTQLQGCSDGTNILPHACQIPCLERQHLRWGLKAGREPVNLPVADCTDLAEILGEDKVGFQLLERRYIYGDDRLSCLIQPPDFGIDYGARGADIYRGGGYPGKVEDRRRVVTLVGDPDQQALISQSGHDLSGGRQQANDSHSRLGQPAGPVVHE